MAARPMKRARTVSHPLEAAAYASALASLPQPSHQTGTWAPVEHDRFLEAMKLYPRGPWKAIADHVATRSVRQVQTHAQKYHEKVVRRLRGLRKPKKKEDDSDEEIGHRVVIGTYGKLRKGKKNPDDHRRRRKAADQAQVKSIEDKATTDQESIDAESTAGSDTDSNNSESPRSVSISVSKMSAIDLHPEVLDMQSFESLLEEQTCSISATLTVVPASAATTELGPGWCYLEDIGDKDLGEPHEWDGSKGLPSLAESLDFFIEFMSITV